MLRTVRSLSGLVRVIPCRLVCLQTASSVSLTWRFLRILCWVSHALSSTTSWVLWWRWRFPWRHWGSSARLVSSTPPFLPWKPRTPPHSRHCPSLYYFINFTVQSSQCSLLGLWTLIAFDWLPAWMNSTHPSKPRPSSPASPAFRSCCSLRFKLRDCTLP